MKKVKSKVLSALIKRMMGLDAEADKKADSCEMEAKDDEEEDPASKGMVTIAISHGKAVKAK